jgi:hypothetical protein
MVHLQQIEEHRKNLLLVVSLFKLIPLSLMVLPGEHVLSGKRHQDEDVDFNEAESASKLILFLVP